MWRRELVDSPPVDELAAMYFKYEPPTNGSGDEDDEETGVWECPFPDATE